ncbi:MAG TPA: alkaline phosphatase D family protein [Methylomirabilota bacterium]|nr:alkaline phosphatase D family protein [Methylomirabilota bacterium]
MLDRILQLDFDFSIMLGDNIYADTTNMAVMKAKYDALEFSPFWKTLRQKAPTLATWDDHDMGGNDAGGNYPMKDESQKLFLEFMDEPPQSPRWKRPGVYDAYTFGPRGKRVQVIMLDTRYFRSKPATGENGVVPSGGKYIPHPDTNTTILGEAQWRWFEEQLRQPAEVRIIATSIQFISEFSGAEAWANFPHEKQRMLALLEKHKTEGVFFISGDRHWAELSRLDRPGRYSLYDLTSSSITQVHPRGTPTPNRYRALPQTYHQPNVGIIEIKWLRSGPMINLQLLDLTGAVQLEKAFLPFPKFSHGQ